MLHGETTLWVRLRGADGAREMCGVLLTNRNPVTNETILDGWAESTSHDTECVTGTPCPTSVKNISFVTEWLRCLSIMSIPPVTPPLLM